MASSVGPGEGEVGEWGRRPEIISLSVGGQLTLLFGWVTPG